VPCVVDSRGPDPVPEHDSSGEFIYALQMYYRFTGDRAFLERHLDGVIAAVGYMESLRAQRLTDEYRLGPPEKRMLYGLLPESISHEGYSAKPMHSYWDDFFALKGLEGASDIAHELGRTDLEERFGRLRDDFRETLYQSMRMAMEARGIDYVPGCAELGDFDATSTAIGVFPCGQRGHIPEPQLTRTFDRYMAFFRDRRAGGAWRDFTPYENRLIGTFVFLGRASEANELLDFFLDAQRPAAWNQWAEVVWREPGTPRFIGDMPHAWVGAEFINAIRTMFVYEDGSKLVLGAGVRPEWLSGPAGVEIRNFPTQFGPISYVLTAQGDRLQLQLSGERLAASCQCVLAIPGWRTLENVVVDGRAIENPATGGLTLDPRVRKVTATLK
jgi:hypothetical protein